MISTAAGPPESECILVVDDDASIATVLRMRLQSEGFRVETAADAATARALSEVHPFSLALVDLRLEDESGIDLMDVLRATDPELPVIILTAFGSIDSAVEAMQKGAFNYLTKPFESAVLMAQIKAAMETRRLTRRVRRLETIVRDNYGFDGFVTRSRQIKKTLALAERMAQSEAPVLITGESGTGKELLAKALHTVGPHRERPFVAVNCAAMPEGLFESELFGHLRGAFTGAEHDKPGLMAEAGQGTFFMDEVSEIPLKLQAKLLRVLEMREFYAVGSTHTQPFQARLIAATNRDMQAEIKAGRFREDLYFRLGVITIRMPALRERRTDIPVLARHFLKQVSGKTGRPIRGFSAHAMQKMLRHDWPGNVRELRNVVEAAVTLSDRDRIEADMILNEIDDPVGPVKPFKAAKIDFERRYLLELMEMSRGNISEAAQLSGKYRADLYALLKKHGIDPERYRK